MSGFNEECDKLHRLVQWHKDAHEFITKRHVTCEDFPICSVEALVRNSIVTHHLISDIQERLDIYNEIISYYKSIKEVE